MTSPFVRFARFETVVLGFALAALALVSGILAPYADAVISRGSRLYGFWNMEQRAREVADKKAFVIKENRLLDSLISIHEKSVFTDENSMVSTLYKRADSAGITASRIEIGEKKAQDGRMQTPVTVQGIGSWQALGYVCEAVENLPAPSRIRFISAARQNKDRTALFMDFVLFSEGE